MYHEVLPVISLQAAMQDLLNKIDGDINFSIQDLIHPKPRRFKRFLSVLINFFRFSETEYDKVENIKTGVEKLVKMKEDLAGKNEELRNKITQFKSKAVEDEAEEADLKEELATINLKFGEGNAKHNKVTELKTIEKQRFEEEEKKTKELEEELKKLENERDEHHAIVDAEAIMARLDQDVVKYEEELALKEKTLVENRNKVEEIEKSNKDWKSMLEIVQQISAEKNGSKMINNKVEEMEKSIKTFLSEEEQDGNIIREEDLRINEKLDVLNGLKSKWTRRKEGKQEELGQAMQELDEARLNCSEEQQHVLKLDNSLRDLELEYGEEQDGLTCEARKVRIQYSQIVEKVKEFNEKMSSDMRQLKDSKDKLNQASSAL